MWGSQFFTNSPQNAYPYETTPANTFSNSWNPTPAQPTKQQPFQYSPTKKGFVDVSKGWNTPAQTFPRIPTLVEPPKAENIEEEISGQNLYKTELCRSFEETGACRYGSKCQFAHGRTELRPVLRHPKYKTEVCKTFYSIGTCPYGKRCRFIHTSAPTVASNTNTVTTNLSTPEPIKPIEPDQTPKEFVRVFGASGWTAPSQTIQTNSAPIVEESVPNTPSTFGLWGSNTFTIAPEVVQLVIPPASPSPPVKNSSPRRLSFFRSIAQA